ncbi:MAG TPA: hypothetical protein VLB68_18150 [Pyrinomonadaceae bacterium]|nr:hypothetical protein [Pyrinomonadaceae bacterium]
MISIKFPDYALICWRQAEACRTSRLSDTRSQAAALTMNAKEN